MAKECELTGKKRMIGNKVSHSNIKSKTVKQVNLKSKKVYDPATGQTVRLRLSPKAIRSLDKIGSLSKMLKKHKINFA